MSLDQMIKSAVRCVKCGAGFGACNCWTKCAKCNCLYETGLTCRRCEGDDTPEIVAMSRPRKRKRANAADQPSADTTRKP